MAGENIVRLSGFRDMSGDTMAQREAIVNQIKEIYRLSGFEALRTPAVERFSVLSGKYGEEGQRLIYKLKGDELALRYDHTVPLADFMAKNTVQLPYKRYAYGPVWRGEKPQAGRYREFDQFDADTVGIQSYLADTEIIGIMGRTMESFGVTVNIGVNDRRLFDALTETAGLDIGSPASRSLIGSIDKFYKIGHEQVVAETRANFGDYTASYVNRYLHLSGSSNQLLDQAQELFPGNQNAFQAVNNLRSIFNTLRPRFQSPIIDIDPKIARGLDYYTSTIYETTVPEASSMGSVCSGGRFDKLIHDLGGPDMPAVGTSVGVDRFFDVLSLLNKLPSVRASASVVIANIDMNLSPQYFALAHQLQDAGITTDFNKKDDKLGQQLKRAESKGARYVLIMGEDEIAKGVVTIKDLATRQQTQVPVEKTASFLQNKLNG